MKIIFNKSFVVATFFLLFLSACSTKEVYKPINIDKDWDKYESTKHTIVDISSNVALLEDRTVLGDSGHLDINVTEPNRIISQSSHWIISASIDGNVTLKDVNASRKDKIFALKKSIASASVNENELAVLFADNEIAIYDLESQAILFKEQGAKFLASDSRIVNPYFMRGLVLFSTLDGKVIFVNDRQKKRLRTVIVSSEDTFNNVISLNVVQNRIIAATSYKLLSMSKKEIRVKYEIRNIAYDEKTIYIATKQGEIVSLTPDLQVNSKIKLPFAHFYGMISLGDKLYILEKEGYMIVVDKASFNYTVHEVDLEDGFIFTTPELFYIDDKKILTN